MQKIYIVEDDLKIAEHLHKNIEKYDQVMGKYNARPVNG